MKKTFVLLAFFFGLGYVFGAGNISIYPALEDKIVGQNLDLNIVAGNVNNFYGYQFDFQYDPSKLGFNSIEFNRDVLGSTVAPQQQFCTSSGDWNIGLGFVKNVACTRTVAGEINPASGALATLKFNVIGQGSSSVNLTKVLVSDSSPSAVSVSVPFPTALVRGCSRIECSSSAECNDFNALTTDICLNASTCISSCSNVAIEQCSEGQITSQCVCGGSVYSSGFCCSNTFTQPCVSDSQCNDADVCTIDSCYQPATCGAQCINTPSGACSPATYCGDGVCSSGENKKNCPQDCGQRGKPRTSSASAIVGSNGYAASSIDFQFEQLSLGSASGAKVSLIHEFEEPERFLVELHVLKDNKLVFFTSETTPLLDAGEEFVLAFSERWVPDETGQYLATVVLSDAEGQQVYDVSSFNFNVTTISGISFFVGVLLVIIVVVYFAARSRNSK